MQYFSSAEQRSGVRIVSAGVHHSRVLRSVFSTGDFMDGQRVHVSAQGDCLFSGPLAFNMRHDSCSRYSLLKRDAESPQLVGDKGGGIIFCEGKLGMFMNVPP